VSIANAGSSLLTFPLAPPVVSRGALTVVLQTSGRAVVLAVEAKQFRLRSDRAYPLICLALEEEKTTKVLSVF